MKHPFSNRADPDPRSTPWEIISLMVATDVKPVLEIAARFVLLAYHGADEVLCGGTLGAINVVIVAGMSLFGLLNLVAGVIVESTLSWKNTDAKARQAVLEEGRMRLRERSEEAFTGLDLFCVQIRLSEYIGRI